MADGGDVAEFCSTGRMHEPHCEYFAGGGGVGGIDFTPDQVGTPAAGQGAPIDFQLDDQDVAQQAQYGTPGQQAIAGLEGAGKGLAGPLSTLVETKLLGVKPKDIVGREEANPVTHTVGEAAGMIGGGELGQLGALGEVGVSAAKVLGLSRAKAAAVKLGVENALYTLGDEISKVITNNPNSVQTAAMHIGLSGLLGSGAGAVFGKASDVMSRLSPKAEAFVTDFVKGLKSRAANVTPEAELAGLDPFTKEPVQAMRSVPVERAGIDPFTREALPPAPEVAPPIPGAGSKAAHKMADYLANAAAEAISGAAGATLGHATGIPGAAALGAYIGHHGLKPLVKTALPALIKPLLTSEASAVGMRSALDAINAIVKGESALNMAAKGLFEEGSKTFVDYAIPDHTRLEKLEKRMEALQADPAQLLELGGGVAHYMPQHQTALAETAQNALNYLSSARPQPTKPGTLNAMVEPSHAQIAAYTRTMQLAEQPLSLFSFLKKGTLAPKDVLDVKALYPGLHLNVIQKVNDQMIDHLSKGKSVPFKMRRGLSMLMGQPLDILLSPSSIQAAQATYALNSSQQAPQEPPKGGGKAKLNKSIELAQTPSEARIKALQKA